MRIKAFFLKTIPSVLMPFIILMFSVILFFKPWFLLHEYGKKSFPPDPLGMTTQERTKLGLQLIAMIVQNTPEISLTEIKFTDGTLAYTEREVKHMDDVRLVFQRARFAWGIAMLLLAAGFVLSWRNAILLADFLRFMMIGSVIAGTLLIGMTILSVLAFEPLFTLFHKLFFTGDSWLFYPHDTLIRLFPLPLWIDAFILIGIFALFLSIAFFFLFRRTLRLIQFPIKKRHH